MSGSTLIWVGEGVGGGGGGGGGPGVILASPLLVG